jgi:hypothetical protein
MRLRTVYVLLTTLCTCTISAQGVSVNNAGTYNEFTGAGSGFQYGMHNVIGGAGSGPHFGPYQAVAGSGTGDQYGLYQDIANTSNSTHYGTCRLYLKFNFRVETLNV